MFTSDGPGDEFADDGSHRDGNCLARRRVWFGTDLRFISAPQERQMMSSLLNWLRIVSVAGLAITVACSDSPTDLGASGSGTVVVKLTDAPFLTDSLKRVDIFVVRVEGRVAAADSTEADSDHENGSAHGWKVLASPNAPFELLSLQNGASVTLGSTSLDAGSYNGFRFIIDPTKSSATLKNGRVLSGSSTPSITFPSASRSGIKVVLSKPVTIVGGGTTTLLLDFDVNESFVMRGNSIDQNGLLFKPVIRGSIVDAATVNATVRLVNATNVALNFLQGGTALTGGSNLAFGASSACSSVNAATPGLTIVEAGATAPLAGFAPALQAGTTYTIVVYPNASGVAQFSTLSNTFAPTTGQAGLRVFNATTSSTGYDVFVTATGAALAVPTVANTLAGTSSLFVSVPAGSSQVRLAGAGATTALLDLGSQAFNAGQNSTLVIAPPAQGSTVPRAFLVGGC
jgi:hypothetical protein